MLHFQIICHVRHTDLIREAPTRKQLAPDTYSHFYTRATSEQGYLLGIHEWQFPDSTARVLTLPDFNYACPFFGYRSDPIRYRHDRPHVVFASINANETYVCDTLLPNGDPHVPVLSTGIYMSPLRTVQRYWNARTRIMNNEI